MNQNQQIEKNRQRVTPAVEITEDSNGYVLTAQLPGVAEEAVHLTVEDRTLVLEADNQVAAPEGFKVLRREIAERHYRAAFELPERVDTVKITSALRNGVLTVTLPKREEVKPRRIAVQVA